MLKELNEQELNYYMLECIQLAKKGEGVRKPHVGAIVLSPEQTILGGGYRSIISGTKLLMHAERMALNNAGEKAKGGYLITTLEPCVKLRKRVIFSSCCELIVERGIDTVIIGLRDNSTEMDNCKGINYLKENNINVIQYGGLNEKIKRELIPKEMRLKKEIPLFFPYPKLEELKN